MSYRTFIDPREAFDSMDELSYMEDNQALASVLGTYGVGYSEGDECLLDDDCSEDDTLAEFGL